MQYAFLAQFFFFYDNERRLSSYAIFSLKNPLSPPVDRSHRKCFLDHPVMYHSLFLVFHPDWSSYLLFPC